MLVRCRRGYGTRNGGVLGWGRRDATVRARLGERNGRPVLCWHGVGITSRASLLLNEAGPLLADGYGLRVLALDAPGFGKSPPSQRDAYQPHALVDLIPPLLEALGLARVAFAGFSWGGDLGCHLAARHPHSLTALVLLDAGYSDPPLDPSLTYEQRVEQNELAWREKCAPSWDAVVTGLRENHPRWTAAVEQACRAGWREQGGRLIPAVPPGSSPLSSTDWRTHHLRVPGHGWLTAVSRCLWSRLVTRPRRTWFSSLLMFLRPRSSGLRERGTTF
jgi:pimeloyl-ACP methyl ester carboxylesterase